MKLNGEYLIVLLVTQLPVTKHFFSKVIPPPSPLIGHLYVMYVIGSTSHVGGINLIYVVLYIKGCHLFIDKVVKETTCE